jgi:signal transduction histidine kinase/CHASE3 domain sensor protein
MNARLILRMTAPVLISSLLLLAIGVGTVWYVHGWQRTVSREVRVNVLAMRAAEELEIAIRESRVRLDKYLITRDQAHLESLSELEPVIERWLAEAERWALTSQEKELMSQLRRAYDRFLTARRELPRSEQPELLQRQVRGMIEVVEEMLTPAHNYLDLNEDEVEQAIGQNQIFAERLVYGLLLVVTCGSGGGLIAGFGFARGFSRSLIQLSVPIRAVAGQLDAVVGPITFSGGDLPQLEGVLRTIAQHLGTVIERLQQSEREALRAEQLAALGQMAAGMAHELRNPLTSMKMLVQGAQLEDPWSSSGGGLGDRDLRILEEEIGRLERLTQCFLDFARPAQPDKQVLDVTLLVEQALRLVADRACAKQIELRCRPAGPGSPLLAAVDPGQLRQVLLNLLLNALEAAPRGGWVEVAVEPAADGGVDLHVSDNGCGLPAHLGAEIFAPFITTKEAGMGLGLSISKRIAEGHGGTLTAANRPEGGAIFTFHLPANPGARDSHRSDHAETAGRG